MKNVRRNSLKVSAVFSKKLREKWSIKVPVFRENGAPLFNDGAFFPRSEMMFYKQREPENFRFPLFCVR